MKILSFGSSSFLTSTLVVAASTSLDYSITPTALGGGGGLSQSANYTAFSAIAGTTVGGASSATYSARYGFIPSAGPTDVTGRFVFYNQSAWDGNSAAANYGDDNAIDHDKVALLPGGTATFDNYTSYSRGLNGIMVDLPLEGAPSEADFVFKRGNDNNPAGWAAVPAAPGVPGVTVRAGKGQGGADRVTIIWPNNLIQKQWLQVTVLATANTGLADTDVFYFGNAIGETGDTPSNAQVNSTDVNGVRSHPRFSINPAPIDYPFDINRDKLVNSTDVNLVRANTTFSVNALRLIQPPSGGGDLRLVTADAGMASDSPQNLAPEVWVLRNPDESISVGLHDQDGGEFALEWSRDLSGGAWEAADAPVIREAGEVVWTLRPDPAKTGVYFRVVRLSFGDATSR